MLKKPFNKKLWFCAIFREKGRILGYAYPKMRGLIAGIPKKPKLLLPGVRDV